MSSAARYLHARAVADRQIRKWGAPAILRRASGDRACWALEAQLSASEKNALKNFNHRIFLISAVNDVLLADPPSKEDSLVLFVQPDGTTELPPLRQQAPVAPLAPGGIVVYWELQVA
jgi:hypothetical protein